ncbi:MAG: cytochrome-c oxidase, cbb3-type subunit III [Pseudomonadota bacterium]
MSEKEKDEISGAETTGHEWDGIKELNFPSPRWWLVVFLLCIIYAFGYWYFYPTLPISKGSLGWTQHKELAAEEAKIEVNQKAYLDKMSKMSLSEIKNDKTMYAFAKDGGAAAFKQNCTACHGSGGAGGKGFPNLNDDDWLWGGKLEDIYKTLKVGIRSGHPEARVSQMPAWGRDGLLPREQIEDVAEYEINLHNGDKAEKTPAYIRGSKIFAANCAVCHGEHGEGKQSVGAPRLNDNIWLYGGDKSNIINVINNAPAGVMPNWDKRLDDNTIKELSIYVHSLGGGE